MFNEILEILVFLSIPAGAIGICGFIGCVVRPDVFKF